MSFDTKNLSDAERDSLRFRFLFPPDSGLAAPRYALFGPDILNFRWQVWDRPGKRTVCSGPTAAEAIDTALFLTGPRAETTEGNPSDV